MRYHLEDIVVKEAWNTPAELQLFRHVIADVARLSVLEIVSGQNLVADLTLGLGQVALTTSPRMPDAPQRAIPNCNGSLPMLKGKAAVATAHGVTDATQRARGGARWARPCTSR